MINKNIAIVFGGKSVEHDISIITALQVMGQMPKNFNLIPIYIKPNGCFVTADNLNDKHVFLDYDNLVKGEKEVSFSLGKGEMILAKKSKIKVKQKIDCALLCGHGHGVEDGCLQGLFEMSGIPYTSCDVSSSAVCMDKVLTKNVLTNADILTPAYVHFDISEYKQKSQDICKNIVKKIKLPCIVKPARLGSSVGISICENEQELACAIDNAFQFDDKVLVEKYIANAREFCSAVVMVENKLFESKVVEVEKGKFFSFEEKYLKEKNSPQKQISKKLENEIKDLAKDTYRSLGCFGVVRVDFLYDQEENKLYVNELNTIPGSLAFNLFENNFSDIVISLVSEAIKREDEKGKIVYKFSSSAISNFIETTNNLKFKN